MSETVRPAFADRERPLLSYGIPFPAAAAEHVTKTFGASRVYVICSGSLSRNTDALGRLTAALGPEKVVGRRLGMQSHTLWSEVLQIVEEARKAKADLLLTLGAGSLTDAAKIVALALGNHVQNASDLATLAEGPSKRPQIQPPTIPIISIPTSLSAGEYSNFAGGTEDRSHRKYSFQAPSRGPQLVILDPELAETTPDSVWLSTGIRAVDHCVETLCATKGTSPESDKLAGHALMLSGGGGGHGCVFQRIGAIGSKSWYWPSGHGETSCILLPAVCKYNARHNANCERQARVRDVLLSDPVVTEILQLHSSSSDTLDLGDILDLVIRELGMPRSLTDVGVGRDKVDGLAENSLHDRWCRTNPVPLTDKSQVLEILDMVL
ncbi:Dehydrogenase FUM7 [Penicillium oxalicum]|uniref:Dehydrogenase FUM7 n=1 Tax=Penicillium oxalicum TaxID=69781 RepID=UPI0020B8CBB3|nr:Dehydrogenase FUM7 [Penicillium oxalicum]KAI2788707.1 Dehydrogenase FUM7 [Penicillium oxalicum]